MTDREEQNKTNTGANLKFTSTPFDSLASVYDAWFEEKGKLTFAIELEALREVIPLLPKPWLEIGVGSGRFAQALEIEFGLDPSSKLLDIAKTRGINVVLGKGEDAPFGSNFFGAIFIITALCFVDSPAKLLKEAHRMLMEGGKIVIGDVLLESPWGQYYQTKRRAGHLFYHRDFYSYTEIAAFLKQAGFSVEGSSSTLFQEPCEVKCMEYPRAGFSPDAGFTVIIASKSLHGSE